MLNRRPPHLVRLRVRNYRSLRDVDVPLGPLNVLVGPNGSGTSTLLDVVGFLADSARLDLASAVERRGGYESLRFRDGSAHPWISIDVEAVAGEHASVNAPDTCSLRFRSAVTQDGGVVDRLVVHEEGRASAGGTRLTVSYPTEGALDLGAHLHHLAEHEQAAFEQVQRDARLMVPGLREIVVRPTAGAVEGLTTQLVEQGLDGSTDLGEASSGTVRALALLALLHDPAPARVTCIEQIEHGLHPYVLDRVVELLREASQRTQLFVTTHSPALVNRLHADELVVCERDASGASRIPAIAAEDVRRMERAVHGELGLGELWFTGALGGVPQA